jgi:cyclic pyranopterin monophosphate synthase
LKEISSKKLTHVDSSGRARMVNVGQKPITQREAVAKGLVKMQPATLQILRQGQAAKGDVLAVAQVAGIMAAKQTSQFIPLCHPLPIDEIRIEFKLIEAESAVEITATVMSTGKTGVEMEALTSVAVSALTIYDMLKAVDRGMRLEAIRLVKKTGGKSGTIELE